MKKKLSIHDIAKQLGISATTVSFVINGKAKAKGISDELEARVLEHIKKVGYKPNLVAQSLRTGKTNVIGMLVEDISDYFFGHIARKVEELAYQKGYKIFFASTENDTEKSKTLIGIFRDRQVDGFIIAPSPGIENEIEGLLNDNVPVILFDRFFPSIPTTNVVIDNFNGSYSAIVLLLKNGYTNIGFVTLKSKQVQMKERMKGYQKAIKEKGLPQFILEVPYDGKIPEIIESIQVFIDTNNELDAVLFATNYLTDYGLDAINRLNLAVPNDLAIISFDDNNHFNLLSPSISAVAQPVEAIAEQVISNLLLLMADKQKPNETIVLPVELIERKSSIPKSHKTISEQYVSRAEKALPTEVDI